MRSHHSGPDPKCVGSATPYLCKVCGDSFATSEEIVAHIVQHCDENTAMRRQPQAGPRKYKRRRKLKPHETNAMMRRNEFPYDVLDGSGGIGSASGVGTAAGSGIGGGGAGGGSDSEENTKRKIGKKNKQHRSSDDSYRAVDVALKTFENSLQNFSSIVQSSNSKLNTKSKLSKKKLRKEEKKQEAQASNQSGRPKMIHTQKTRVPVEIGSDGAKKGQKTKTMVTRTPKVMPNEHKSGIFPGGERNRPRTKNVSYHIDSGKLQFTPAMFPATKNVKEETISPVAKQQQLMTNVKVEPGMQKTVATATGDSHKNNNGNILALGKTQELSTKKKTTMKRAAAKRQKHSVKQEPNLSAESIVEEQRQEQQPQQQMQTRNSSNAENNGDSIRLLEHAVDGSNLEVAFEASVVTARDDQEEDEEEESILPHAVDEIGNCDNVKLSVKVESAPQTRMLAVHSVIAPVDDVPETIIPDVVEYTCEMCAAVFPSRAELLVHVPIHI